MVRVDFLKTFLTVAKTGSFKKAAKELGISVSSVSFQINAVEEFYGATLLKRGVDGVKLTDEGKIALKNIESVLSSLEEAKKLIANIGGGKIVIASGMVGINVVFNIQTLLKAKYPEVDVRVELRGAHECVRGVMRGDYDFAIVGDILEEHLNSDRLYVEEIGMDKLVLIVPPNHPLADKEIVMLRDVMEYPVISLTDYYGITTSLKKALKSSGVSFDDLNVAYVVEDLFSQINSVSNGLGVAITSYIAVCKACEIGLIKIRDIKDLESERKIFFVSTKLSMESKRIREYADFITRNARTLFATFYEQCLHEVR
uniref:LysR family transcriptional regulator n=1 Tax=Geoglobus ahangari TaxID=113653 RepID=A0A7C4S4X0_9EURY